MLTFAVAEQSVDLGGTTLQFDVDKADTSIVRLNLVNADGSVWALAFKRNGALLSKEEKVEPKPKGGDVNSDPTRSKPGVQPPTIGPRCA